MGYVVVHQGEMSEPGYRDYLRLVGRRLLAHNIGLDRVPRTAATGRPGCWLYVFDDEAAARELAEELKQFTQDDGWDVRPVEGPVEEGPLLPILLELGVDREGVGFRLNTFTKHALRTRFPGAVPHNNVWLDTECKQTFTVNGLRELALELLPVLTGLNPGQLHSFGGFEVINPVTAAVVVPFTPLKPPAGEPVAARSPTHSGSATSPESCTAVHPG